jgi:AcrR family transcriptional regulator
MPQLTQRGSSSIGSEPPSLRREGIRDAQARKTRAKVLESAVACIDELGIARASSNEIARRAGMTWGAIQHHFGSREDLLLSVIESNFSELESNVRNASFVGGSTLERVQALADLLWDYCSDARFRVSIEILLDLRRDPAGSEMVAQRLSDANYAMSTMWDEICVRALDLPSDPTIARILFGAARGFALTRHMNGWQSSFTQERALLVQLLANAIEHRVEMGPAPQMVRSPETIVSGQIPGTPALRAPST